MQDFLKMFGLLEKDQNHSYSYRVQYKKEVISARRSVCLSKGCVSALGGGESAQDGVSACGGVCPGRWRVYITPLDPEADTPLWTEFLTHICENITFPQLLL